MHKTLINVNVLIFISINVIRVHNKLILVSIK
jgi:hypothetical protein